MPTDLEVQRLRLLWWSPREHACYLSMQMLPCWPRHRVVRLGPDQLVSELEPAVHLTQKALLKQPRQGFARRRRRQADDVVEPQVGEPATQHRREIERRPRRGLEPATLPDEHGPDGTWDPDVSDGLRVQRLDVAQQRARAVRHPLLREQLESQRVAVPRLQDPPRPEAAPL